MFDKLFIKFSSFFWWMINPGKSSNYFFIHKDTYRFFHGALNWRLVGDMSKKIKNLTGEAPCLPTCLPVGVIQFDSNIFFWPIFCGFAGPEWTSTQLCTNVDGWCIDRILFSIHVPFRLTFFCLHFLSPDLSFFFLVTLFSPRPLPSFFFPLISDFFFWNFIFSPPPTQVFFNFFAFETFPAHPPTYYPPPPSFPLRPTPLYI